MNTRKIFEYLKDILIDAYRKLKHVWLMLILIFFDAGIPLLLYNYGSWNNTSTKLAALLFFVALTSWLIIIQSKAILASNITPLKSLILYSLSVLFLIILFAFSFGIFGIKPASTGIDLIADSVYLSFITWTTVGYGDIAPTGYSRIFSAFEGIVSYIFMALLMVILVKFINPNNDQNPPPKPLK